MGKVQALFCGLMMLVSIGSAGINDGRPFGPVTEQDVENLKLFAKERGLDLNAEMKAVYASNDEEAFAKVFASRFTSISSIKMLAPMARCFTAVYSTWERLGGFSHFSRY